MTTELQHLPVKLTDAELLARGRESGELALAIQQVHDELAAAKIAAKEKLKVFGDRDRELDRQLRSGTEDRDVECELRFDFDAGIVRTVRLDTDEVVSERDVTDEERQSTLEQALFKAPKESRRVREAKKKGDGGLADFMDRQDKAIAKQKALRSAKKSRAA